MRSNVIFFLGLFAALGLSWAGIVLGSNAQLGALAPYFDASQETAFPQGMPGEAARGQLVYRDLGCAACHTQQVRRPGFGSDQARGWGERQSVARDYIYQPYPQLGLARVGPDLTNLGDRKPTAPDEDDLLRMLYAGSDDMPAYRFLFEERRVGSGAQRSDQALQLTGALEPAAGWEIVPTARARALVAYLVNLKTAFDYPEAIPYVPPQPEGAAQPKPPAAPANGPAPSAPKGAAAAPAAAGAAPASPPGANAPAPTAAPTAANPGPAGVSAPTPTAAPAGSQIPAAAGAAPASPPGANAPAPTAAPTAAKAGGAQ